MTRSEVKRHTGNERGWESAWWEPAKNNKSLDGEENVQKQPGHPYDLFGSIWGGPRVSVQGTAPFAAHPPHHWGLPHDFCRLEVFQLISGRDMRNHIVSQVYNGL